MIRHERSEASVPRLSGRRVERRRKGVSSRVPRAARNDAGARQRISRDARRARRKAAPTPKTAPSSTVSMKPGRSFTAKTPYGFARTGQTICNVTDSKIIKLFVDDEPFWLPHAKLLNYDRRLNMKAGHARPRDPLGDAGRQAGADQIAAAGLLRRPARGGDLLSRDAPQRGCRRRDRFGDGVARNRAPAPAPTIRGWRGPLPIACSTRAPLIPKDSRSCCAMRPRTAA